MSWLDTDLSLFTSLHCTALYHIKGPEKSCDYETLLALSIYRFPTLASRGSIFHSMLIHEHPAPVRNAGFWGVA
jgi:hypothetical protein